MIVIIRDQDKPDEITFKTLQLIQKWGHQFENQRDILPLFSEVYHNLKSKGVPFPEDARHRRTTVCQQQVGSNNKSSMMTELKMIPSKYKQLMDDMNQVKGNINLANMMIDEAKPDISHEDNPIYDLLHALKDMEIKLLELIPNLDHEEMLKICLIVNDDFQKTLIRYDKLINGKHPGEFIPGESQYNTLMHPSVVYEKEEKAQRASIMQFYISLNDSHDNLEGLLQWGDNTDDFKISGPPLNSTQDYTSPINTQSQSNIIQQHNQQEATSLNNSLKKPILQLSAIKKNVEDMTMKQQSLRLSGLFGSHIKKNAEKYQNIQSPLQTRDPNLIQEAQKNENPFKISLDTPLKEEGVKVLEGGNDEDLNEDQSSSISKLSVRINLFSPSPLRKAQQQQQDALLLSQQQALINQDTTNTNFYEMLSPIQPNNKDNSCRFQDQYIQRREDSFSQTVVKRPQNRLMNSMISDNDLSNLSQQFQKSMQLDQYIDQQRKSMANVYFGYVEEKKGNYVKMNDCFENDSIFESSGGLCSEADDSFEFFGDPMRLTLEKAMANKDFFDLF